MITWGIENGDIPDENIQASDFREDITGWPWKGRLNRKGVWAVDDSVQQPWIEADIGYQTYVSGVITQGDGNTTDGTPDWVTTFKVSTFEMSTGDEEVFVEDGSGKVKVSALTPHNWQK